MRKLIPCLFLVILGAGCAVRQPVNQDFFSYSILPLRSGDGVAITNNFHFMLSAEVKLRVFDRNGFSVSHRQRVECWNLGAPFVPDVIFIGNVHKLEMSADTPFGPVFCRWLPGFEPATAAAAGVFPVFP